MDTQPAFGRKQLFTHVVGDMAKAVSERNGEPKQQQVARREAAIHMIMGFLPRDVVEVMLAGHCVMLHELMTDSVRVTLAGEVDTMRRVTRASIVAMDKAFASNLAQLEPHQRRPLPGQRDAPEADDAAPAEQATASAVEIPATLAPAPASPDAVPTVVFHPSDEVIEACRANPEALAALEAGDPEGFVRAMGFDMPSAADLAAAGPGSVFTIDRAGVRLVPSSPHGPKLPITRPAPSLVTG